MGGRHGLAAADEDEAETALRLREEAELAAEIGGELEKARAGARAERKRDEAARKREEQTKARAVAAEEAAAREAARLARDEEYRKRGEEALRKEQEEQQRRRLAEEVDRKAKLDSRTGGGFKLSAQK